METRGECLESISCEGDERSHREMVSWKGKWEAKHFLFRGLFCAGCGCPVWDSSLDRQHWCVCSVVWHGSARLGFPQLGGCAVLGELGADLGQGHWSPSRQPRPWQLCTKGHGSGSELGAAHRCLGSYAIWYRLVGRLGHGARHRGEV